MKDFNYQCPDCKENFSNYGDAFYHRYTNACKPKNNYDCPICKRCLEDSHECSWNDDYIHSL